MINSSSLFHFTRDFGAFKHILTEGLRFGYCYEPFGEIVAKQGWDIELMRGNKVITCEGIAIPLISFCDIPLLRTREHRKKFGDYMIGFNREALINVVNATKYMLNPVQYRCHPFFDEQLEELSIQKSCFISRIESSEIPIGGIEIIKGEKRDEMKFSNLVMRSEIREKYKEEIQKITAIDSIIGFSKPYQGKCGDDYMSEREWRIIIPDCYRPAPNLGWLKYISKEQFEHYKIKLLDNYPSELYLHFDCVDITSLITHIVVSKESERNLLIHLCLNKGSNVLGCNLSESQRMNLISKISSFEQITKDY